MTQRDVPEQVHFVSDGVFSNMCHFRYYMALRLHVTATLNRSPSITQIQPLAPPCLWQHWMCLKALDKVDHQLLQSARVSLCYWRIGILIASVCLYGGAVETCRVFVQLAPDVQGGGLYSVLFAVYANDYIFHLASSAYGCYMGHKYVGMYADLLQHKTLVQNTS